MPSASADNFVYTEGVNSFGGSCLAGDSDGAGTLAALKNDADENAAPHVTLLNSSGGTLGSFDFGEDLGGSLQAQASGFTALDTYSCPGPPCHQVSVKAWSATGALLGSTVFVNLFVDDDTELPDRLWSGTADPSGGLLVAHESADSTGWNLYAQSFDGVAAPRLARQTIASSADLGIQPQTLMSAMTSGGNALVVWDNGTATRAAWTDSLGRIAGGTFALPQRWTAAGAWWCCSTTPSRCRPAPAGSSRSPPRRGRLRRCRPGSRLVPRRSSASCADAAAICCRSPPRPRPPPWRAAMPRWSLPSSRLPAPAVRLCAAVARGKLP